MKTVKAVIAFVVLLFVSAVSASTLSPPTHLAPAEGQGTDDRPWFRWTAVGTHFYKICIWPIETVVGYCPDGASVNAFVDGTDADTQSWRPDTPFPATWMGQRLRVTLATCTGTPSGNSICGNDSSRDFFPLKVPTLLTVTLDPQNYYRYVFNWRTVRSADSYLVSFCCTASGDPRVFLVPGGAGGRPLILPEPGSFAGLQDYSTRNVCFSPARPITWTVAACRDGGCGDRSPEHTFCYDFGGTSPPTNAPPQR